MEPAGPGFYFTTHLYFLHNVIPALGQDAHPLSLDMVFPVDHGLFYGIR